MRPAKANRPCIKTQHFDLIVIGGGVNGVAIARECALGGKRTLLLEQNDFGSGTSSRSTRIIHGGLRYLEHGELALVRESLLAREDLLQSRPNLVHPTNFLLVAPAYAKTLSLRNSLALRAGLMLYKQMARVPRRCASPATDVALLERSLVSGKKCTILNFEDAQCEFPERLIAEWLVEAIHAGAMARNHTEVLAIQKQFGRVSGVIVRDLLTEVESEYSSTTIINATGPWADRICEASGIHTQRMIGGVRGSHILLPRAPNMPESVVYAEAVDGRPFFVIPWNGQTLVGTTEVQDDGDPSSTQATRQEITYLLSSYSKIFPNHGLRLEDIKSCFAGIRPLPFVSNANAAGITRRHFVHSHADDGALGLISITGGKLTTAGRLARECANEIGVHTQEPVSALVIGVPEDQPGGVEQFDISKQQADACISPSLARDITEWYGPNAKHIINAAIRDPFQAQHLCPHGNHLVAEAVYAWTEECASTLGDLLLRRVPVALAACWSDECSRVAAERIGRALNWSKAMTELNLEAFEVERAKFLHRVPTE